jgi:Flp pilus assembly protein TadD
MSYWREPYMDLYVPVTYMVWGVVAGVSYGDVGLDPRVFHTFNVLLHAGNAALVFLLLRRLLGDARTWAAAAGAALFAVHPVQVEPVGWVSGMKDLLCGTFTLVSLWAYVVFAQASAAEGASETQRGRRWWYYGLGIFAFVLAMLSKPTAVVTPVMAAAIDVLVLRRRGRDVAVSIAPWLVLAVPCVVWTKHFQAAEHVADEVPPIWQRVLVATDALAFYLGKLVFPWRLAIDYGRKPLVAVGKGWVYYTWLAPAACAAALLLARRRVSPAVAAGVVLAGLGLLPVLGIVPFDFQAYSTVADHYLYLPMAGLALAAAALLGRWPAARWGPAAAAVLLVLTARSMAQAGHWHDNVTLFRHALDVNPYSGPMNKSLAAALRERGELGEALAAAQRAVELDPGDPRSRITLGSVLAASGRLPQAEATFRGALGMVPTRDKEVQAFALGQLAGVVAQQGRVEEGQALARQALQLHPDEANAHLNLGIMLAQQGRRAEAATELELAARLSRDPLAYTYLGLIQADMGRFDDARRNLQSALAIVPNYPRARDALMQLDAVQSRR